MVKKKKKGDNLGDDAVPYNYFLSRLICPKEETLVTCRFRNGHLEEETKFFATAVRDPLFWSRASGDSWNVYIHTAFRSQPSYLRVFILAFRKEMERAHYYRGGPSLR